MRRLALSIPTLLLAVVAWSGDFTDVRFGDLGNDMLVLADAKNKVVVRRSVVDNKTNTWEVIDGKQATLDAWARDHGDSKIDAFLEFFINAGSRKKKHTYEVPVALIKLSGPIKSDGLIFEYQGPGDAVATPGTNEASKVLGELNLVDKLLPQPIPPDSSNREFKYQKALANRLLNHQRNKPGVPYVVAIPRGKPVVMVTASYEAPEPVNAGKKVDSGVKGSRDKGRKIDWFRTSCLAAVIAVLAFSAFRFRANLIALAASVGARRRALPTAPNDSDAEGGNGPVPTPIRDKSPSTKERKAYRQLFFEALQNRESSLVSEVEDQVHTLVNDGVAPEKAVTEEVKKLSHLYGTAPYSRDPEVSTPNLPSTTEVAPFEPFSPVSSGTTNGIAREPDVREERFNENLRKIQTREQAIQRREHELQALADKLSERQGERAKLERELAEQKNVVSKLKGEAKTKDEAVKSKEKMLTDANEKWRAEEKDAQRLRTERNSLRNEAIEAKGREANLKKKVEEANKNNGDLQRALNQSLSFVEESTQKLRNITRRVESMKEEAEKL